MTHLLWNDWFPELYMLVTISLDIPLLEGIYYIAQGVSDEDHNTVKHYFRGVLILFTQESCIKQCVPFQLSGTT